MTLEEELEAANQRVRDAYRELEFAIIARRAAHLKASPYLIGQYWRNKRTRAVGKLDYISWPYNMLTPVLKMVKKDGTLGTREREMINPDAWELVTDDPANPS